MVGFVEQTYTFVENQLVGTIQVRKDAASDVRFMVRVLGGEKKRYLIFASTKL